MISAEFSPDGQRVVIASDDTAKIWNVAHLMKDPFNTTQELINAARESIPKGLTHRWRLGNNPFDEWTRQVWPQIADIWTLIFLIFLINIIKTTDYVN